MNEFKKALQSAEKGSHFPVLRFTREDPEMAASISKAIKGITPNTYDNTGNIAPQLPNVSALRNIGSRKAQDIVDAKTVMQVLPDLKRTKQILISSILAPKDMVTIEMNYTSVTGLLPPEVSSEMMDVIKTYLDQDYKITPKLSEIFGDALFDKGSYVIAIIPENTLDDLINNSGRVSMEGLSEHFKQEGDGLSIRNLGLVGPAVKSKPTPLSTANMSMESFGDHTPVRDVDRAITLTESFSAAQETFLTITDNPVVLKLPRLQQKIREQRVMGALFNAGVATESHTTRLTPMNDRHLMGIIYKDRKFKYNPITTLKTQDQLSRNSAGSSLVMHIPSEACIPVFVPGDKTQQLGVLVLTDGEGHPLSTSSYNDSTLDMGARLSASGSFPSAMLNKVKGQMEGFNAYNQQHLDYSARVFGEMVEQEMLARFRNGHLGDGVSIGKNDKFNYIMYARSLSQQHTQLVFMPSELVTYIAFEYDDNGLGQSILDQMKIINSLRTAVRFANVTAGVKNAIGRTQVAIKLDERDPDPFKTEEFIKHEVVRSRQKALPPVGMTSPTDIVDHLNLASMDFTTEGHPGMPDIKIDFSEKNANYVKPDNELSEDLRKDSIMAAGVPPELVDSGIPIEFATTAVSNNILLSKQVITLQDIGMPQVSDSIRKFLTHSPRIQNDLMGILEKNKDKLQTRIDEYIKDKQVVEGQKESIEKYVLGAILKEFIANFEGHLPRPNSVTLENQLAALEVYEKGLDKVLDQIINSSFFTTDTGGNVAAQADLMKALAKAQYMRRYISENGILPELSELTAQKEDGNEPMLNIYESMKDHVEALMKSFVGFAVSIQPMKNAADKVLEAEAAPLEGGGGTPSTDDGSGGTTDSQNTDDEDFLGNGSGSGMDDLPGGQGGDGVAAPTPEAEGTDAAAKPADDTEAEPT